MIWQNVVDALYRSAEMLGQATREESKAGELASAATAGTAAIVIIHLAEALQAGIETSTPSSARSSGDAD